MGLTSFLTGNRLIIIYCNLTMKHPLDMEVNSVTSIIWIGMAMCSIYFSNFFYNIFNNPDIKEPFFSLSMGSFSFLIVYAIYVSYYLPMVCKVRNCEEYNPRIITIGAAAGAIALATMLIAIWPVWGFTSIWMLSILWKGFW
jgi:hypothetical protein